MLPFQVKGHHIALWHAALYHCTVLLRQIVDVTQYLKVRDMIMICHKLRFCLKQGLGHQVYKQIKTCNFQVP